MREDQPTVSSPVRRRLALIILALAFAVIGVVLRLARDSIGVATVAQMALVGTATVGFLYWGTLRLEDSALRQAIQKNHAVGGVPCAIPLESPVWGCLVITPTAYVWEPNKRASAAGHEAVRIDNRISASSDFHTVPVGVRHWPAVTIASPDREPFTVAMSKASAERLKQLLTANPSTTLG